MMAKVRSHSPVFASMTPAPMSTPVTSAPSALRSLAVQPVPVATSRHFSPGCGATRATTVPMRLQLFRSPCRMRSHQTPRLRRPSHCAVVWWRSCQLLGGRQVSLTASQSVLPITLPMPSVYAARACGIAPCASHHTRMLGGRRLPSQVSACRASSYQPCSPPAFCRLT
jgi:hypothetical protein